MRVNGSLCWRNRRMGQRPTAFGERHAGVKAGGPHDGVVFARGAVDEVHCVAVEALDA